MKKRRLLIILGLLVVLLLPATPVYADTPDPDSTPTVVQINVYQNMREAGDWLVLIYANIPYGLVPDQPVTETFIWSMINTDNVTELGSTVGYAYNVGTYQDDGFGYNVYSMYWDSDNVTELDLDWNTNYPIRLAGNPAVFDTPPVYNYTIGISDYSTEVDDSSVTAQADVQAELAERVLFLAADLDVKWGLSATYSLLIEEETGPKLSTFGQAFFRGAIYGLQALAPGVFPTEIRLIDVEARDWDTEYSENVTGQWGDTWVDTAQAAGKALFGTDYDLLSIIMLLVMGTGLLIGNIMLTGDHWNGLVDVAVIMVIGARLGMYDLAFLILVAALCWMYIGTKVWFGMIR